MTRPGSRGAMYFRMLFRAAALRKGQAAAALTAIVVSAAATTAMLNLVVDVQAKLRTEFRNFGANIVVEARSGGSLSPEMLEMIAAAVSGHGLAVPFAYAVARDEKDRPIVVAGTDFELVRRLNPWWEVSRWPQSSGEVLVGVRAARLLASDTAFTLRFHGHSIRPVPKGTLRTGAGEDSRVYMPLEDFRSWTGIDPSVVEIAAHGPPGEVTSLLEKLQQTLPVAEVRAVRQVTEGEANVLGKTRSTLLSSAAFIVGTAALCVLATLMGWVLDRRRDFAIMKALGASDGLMAMFVAGEAVVLAFAGAVLGFAAGTGVAAWIGRANFHAPVVPRLSVFPAVLAGCLAVTLLATLLPLRLLRRIQPAMILRGE